jgi:uncharacterized protein (DUF2062 family)
MQLNSSIYPVVVAPTYNNVGTVIGILGRISATGLPLIVVNDGSTDGSSEALHKWLAEPEGSKTQIVVHSKNRGKATALQTGFKAAIDAGYTHAVTIDTDGQLDPEQIPDVLETANANPEALIVGCRDDRAADYPAKSRVGRRVSNTLVWIESGVRVGDSQCGLRVYPLELVKKVRCRAKYFGFETEIITRAGWAGCPVVGTPVRCRYLPPGERVSHFRPWRDSFRSVGMHARLILRALVPWPGYPRYLAPNTSRSHAKGSVRRIIEWLSPASAIRQLRQEEQGPVAIATAISLGVFIGTLPIYGVQSIVALYSARRLHLHPIAVLLGSQISLPPLSAILSMASIALGHSILHGQLPTLAEYNVSRLGFRAVFQPLMLDWSLGSLILGLVLAILIFCPTAALLRRVQRTNAINSLTA